MSIRRRCAVGARTSARDDAARLRSRRRWSRCGCRSWLGGHLRNRLAFGCEDHEVSSGGASWLDRNGRRGSDRGLAGRRRSGLGRLRGDRLAVANLGDVHSRCRWRFRGCGYGGRLRLDRRSRFGRHLRADRLGGGVVGRSVGRSGCRSFGGRRRGGIVGRLRFHLRRIGLLRCCLLRRSLLLRRRLLLGSLLDRLGLFGLFVADEALALGAAAQHVGIGLLQGRRGCLRGNTRSSSEVQNLFVGHPELFRELVDADLLRRHVSIQPFPVVIPSPGTQFSGCVSFVCRRVVDCSTYRLDVLHVERHPPRTGKLLRTDRCIEALVRRSAVVTSTQPRTSSATRCIDLDGRDAVTRRPCDAHELVRRSACAAADTAANGVVLINRWTQPSRSRQPRRMPMCRTRSRRLRS